MYNHFTQDNEKRRKNNAKPCETKQNEAKRCNSPPPNKYMRAGSIPAKEYVYQHFFPVNNKKNKCFGLQINGI